MADGWEPREDTTGKRPGKLPCDPAWVCGSSDARGPPQQGFRASRPRQPRRGTAPETWLSPAVNTPGLLFCRRGLSSQTRPKGSSSQYGEAQAQAIALCGRKAVFLPSRWHGRGRTEPRYLKVTNCVCKEEDFIPCGASHEVCSKLSFAGNSMFSTKCWKLRRRLQGIILRSFAFVVPWFLLSGRAYQ